jgi:hypothetical protein
MFPSRELTRKRPSGMASSPKEITANEPRGCAFSKPSRAGACRTICGMGRRRTYTADRRNSDFDDLSQRSDPRDRGRHFVENLNLCTKPASDPCR